MESVVLAVAQNGFNTIKQPAAQRFTVKCDVLAKLIEEVHYMGRGGGWLHKVVSTESFSAKIQFHASCVSVTARERSCSWALCRRGRRLSGSSRSDIAEQSRPSPRRHEVVIPCHPWPRARATLSAFDL